MTVPARLPTPSAPDDVSAVYLAIGDTLATAATYAEAGVRFSEVRDPKGVAYATRCAAAAVATAAELVAELRPQARGGHQP